MNSNSKRNFLPANFRPRITLWNLYFISLFIKMNLYQIQCFLLFSFFTNMSGHFNTPLEFYACDWIKTLWKQHYSQTPRNSFFAFPMFIRIEQAPVSGHLTLTSLIGTYEIISSRKRPAPVPFTVLILKFAAPVTDNFFSSPGCPPTRASTVESIILGFKAKENDVIAITITKTKTKTKRKTTTITITKTITITITKQKKKRKRNGKR